MFKLNVGGLDRVLRITVGAAVVLATVLGLLNVWGWLGLIPLATGLMGFCPLYTVLGFKTCKVDKK